MCIRDSSYTVLYAPFDGIAGISKTNIGDLVSPESGPLAVVSLSLIHISRP